MFYMFSSSAQFVHILNICSCFVSFNINRLLAIALGEGDGTPLQYSCLENPVDGGAWKAAVHGVTKNQTCLSTCTHKILLLLSSVMALIFILLCPLVADENVFICQKEPLAFMLLLLGHFSHVQLCVTLWTSAFQSSLSTGFSRQEYWSRLPCPPLGDLPDPGIKTKFPVFTAEPPGRHLWPS